MQPYNVQTVTIQQADFNTNNLQSIFWKQAVLKKNILKKKSMAC